MSTPDCDMVDVATSSTELLSRNESIGLDPIFNSYPFIRDCPSNVWNVPAVIPNPSCTNDDEPRVFYRTYHFSCEYCNVSWASPLLKAQTGLFCKYCCHFTRPYAQTDHATPYRGDLVCYAQYRCHKCDYTWYSNQSRSNYSRPCSRCGVPNYPHIQIPLGIKTSCLPNEFFNLPNHDTDPEYSYIEEI